MELKLVKKVKAEDAKVIIEIDINSSKVTAILEYTCGNCFGHGCGKHGSLKSNPDCFNGAIEKSIDLLELEETFDKDIANKIKTALQLVFDKNIK